MSWKFQTKFSLVWVFYCFEASYRIQVYGTTKIQTHKCTARCKMHQQEHKKARPSFVPLQSRVPHLQRIFSLRQSAHNLIPYENSANITWSGTLCTGDRSTQDRDGICHSRHSRRECKIFASGVNFSRNNAVCYINESKKLHYTLISSQKLLTYYKLAHL